jgi:hypothetical protein
LNTKVILNPKNKYGLGRYMNEKKTQETGRIG